jgi:hypothetical protein
MENGKKKKICEEAVGEGATALIPNVRGFVINRGNGREDTE